MTDHRTLSERLSKIETDMGWVKRVLGVVLIAIFVPKVGGPDPSQVVAGLVHYLT